jgi:hypothetical protein
MRIRDGRRLSFIVLGVAGAASISTLVTVDALASPHNDYMLQCQGCHQPDGSGSSGSVPDMRDTIGLFLGVPGGREFLVGVPGSAQSPLSNAELAEVLNWMIVAFGPREVAARFTPFTADEVALTRRPLADVEPARNALMDLIEAGRTSTSSSHIEQAASQQ